MPEIDRVTRINTSQTPIVEYLKGRVPSEMIKDWSSNWGDLDREGLAKGDLNSRDIKANLTQIHTSFFRKVNELAEEISEDPNFEKAVAIKPLNKYQTCVISGLRERQKELGIRPNLNQVKYVLVMRALKK